MPEPILSLNRIKIDSPCQADWNSMIGNDQVRFCEHCSLQVSDLSTMTRPEARRLVARSQGRLCVRYIQRPDGGPSLSAFPQKLYRISRRVSRIAAGAFTATLSLSNAVAQTRSNAPAPQETSQVAVTTGQRGSLPKENTASLSGTITDQNDAVIPNAAVRLVNTASGAEQTTTTSDNGEYLFQALSAGAYTLFVTAPGFKTMQMNEVQVQSGSGERVNATLEVGMIAMGGAVAFVEPEEPLVKAAFKDDLAAVKALAFAATDINVRDKFTNMTALDQAVENGNLEIVRTLLWAGASVKAKGEHGSTVLMYLRENATAELVKELIGAGAKVNAKDENGSTVLLNAASLCNVDALKVLLEAGVKVDAKDNDGKTALMLAVSNEDPQVSKMLIDLGADVNVKDHEDNTALMFAAEDGKAATVKLLIDAGADINARDEDGQTSLMRANEPDIVLVLLNAGADVTIKDKEGNTALSLARKYEQKEVIKLLESRGAPE